MRLVDDGRLDLDRSLRAYLPVLRSADPIVATTVTARHRLTRSAGWVGDYFLISASSSGICRARRRRLVALSAAPRTNSATRIFNG